MISSSDRVLSVQLWTMFSFDIHHFKYTQLNIPLTEEEDSRKGKTELRNGKRFPYIETFNMISMRSLPLPVRSQVSSECHCSLTIECFFVHISFVHAMYTICIEVPRQNLSERVYLRANCVSIKDVNFSTHYFKKLH